MELKSIVRVQHLADCDQGRSPKGFISIGFYADDDCGFRLRLVLAFDHVGSDTLKVDSCFVEDAPDMGLALLPDWYTCIIRKYTLDIQRKLG